MKKNFNLEYNRFNMIKTKNKLISQINVNSVENARMILDSALSYRNNVSEDGLSYREDDLHRIMVNNIRHEQCPYDKSLNKLRKVSYKAKYNKQVMYHLYKNATLTAISREYPFLEKECDRQKYRMPMIKLVKN